MLRRAAAGLLLLLSAAAAPVRADDAEGAQRLFEQAVSALVAGELPRSAELFERSMALYPTAATAFNLAGVLLDLGRVRHAVQLARDLLDGRHGELGTEQRAQVEQLHAHAERALGQLRIRGEGAPRIDITIDGAAVGAVPGGATLVHPVDPGQHTIMGRAEGRAPIEQQVQVDRGERADVVLRLLPSRAPSPARADEILAQPAPPPRARDAQASASGGVPAWLWVAGGVVIAGAAVAAALVLGAGDEATASYWGDTGT